MGESKREKGFHYEDVACSFLVQKGYEIVERNYYNRYGEIDIIAKDGNYLVFVEVKYRDSDSYGYPVEFVDRKKQSKIIKTANYYIMKTGITTDALFRFDIVGIVKDDISLIQDAFGV